MNEPIGNWQEAKRILDSMSEPNASFDLDRHHLDIHLPKVLGYLCQYVKCKTKKGIKSWLVLTNGQLNCVYMKHFGEVTDEEASEIFS